MPTIEKHAVPFIDTPHMNALVRQSVAALADYEEISDELARAGAALDDALTGEDDDAYVLAFTQSLAFMCGALLTALLETRQLVRKMMVAPSSQN